MSVPAHCQDLITNETRPYVFNVVCVKIHDLQVYGVQFLQRIPIDSQGIFVKSATHYIT